MRALFLALASLVLVVSIAFVGFSVDLEAPAEEASAALVAGAGSGLMLPATRSEPVTPSPTPLATLMPAASAPAPTSRGLAPPPGAAAKAVLLLDDASGAVLFERNGRARLAPASLTKIATAVVAIERGDLDAVVENPAVDSRNMRDSSVMGLLPGDRFTMRDLLYGLMLPSGNDAAIVIGRHIAGSDPAFVDEMNALVRRLALQDTHFANAHGLGAVAHYSSAYDLAILSRYAMTLPAYQEIASADVWTARGSRELPMYSLITEARWAIPGADAGKSGFTDSAGRTLVISAAREGHRLYAVVLNDKYTEADAAALIDWGFANFEWPAPAAPAPAAPERVPTSTAVPADDSKVEALRTAE